jgi:hypothetical protein
MALVFVDLIKIPHLYENHPYNLICFFVNIFVCMGFIVTTFRPQTFGIISFFSFLYSILIIPFNPTNSFGYPMYFLCYATLLARGKISRDQKPRIIIYWSFYVVLILSQLHFGLNTFITEYLEQDFVLSLLLVLVIFFVVSHMSNRFEPRPPKLNLAFFKNIDHRDFEFLLMVQANEKYSTIAQKYHMSEGSVKNRLHEVYKILKVEDKQGFMTMYGDTELYYDPKEKPKKSDEKKMNGEAAAEKEIASETKETVSKL